MESWRLLPLIVAAATCTWSAGDSSTQSPESTRRDRGRLWKTLDNLAGPYGGVVGLVTGAIVVALPIWEEPRAKAVRPEQAPQE